MENIRESDEKAKTFVEKDNFMEVDYENVCSDPIGVFGEVIAFCELEWCEKFDNEVRRQRVNSSDYNWRTELTGEQQDIIESVIQG